MKTTQEIMLEMRVSDMLILFGKMLVEDNLSYSDIQGVAQADAIKIIELVKEA